MVTTTAATTTVKKTLLFHQPASFTPVPASASYQYLTALYAKVINVEILFHLISIHHHLLAILNNHTVFE